MEDEKTFARKVRNHHQGRRGGTGDRWRVAVRGKYSQREKEGLREEGKLDVE